MIIDFIKTIKINNVKITSIILIVFSIACSCHKSTTPQHSKDLLTRAQQLAEVQPSEALKTLDSISHPETMDEEDYMSYIVAKAQAKFRNRESIAKDTLIFKARDYFDNTDNPTQSALANFYSGNVHSLNNRPKEALEAYRKTIHYTLKQKNIDNILIGKATYNMGYQYFDYDIRDSALVYFKKAMNILNKEENTDLFKMTILQSLGTTMYYDNYIDSLAYYATKGLDLATKNNNFHFLGIFNNQIGVTLRERGDYEGAKKLFEIAINQSSNSNDSTRIYLNLIKLYSYTNQLDSVAYFRDIIDHRISETTDKHMLLGIYSFYTKQYQKEGNYEKALQYANLQDSVGEEIFAYNKSKELLAADKRISLSIKDEELKNLQTHFIVYIGGSVLLLIGFSLLFRYMYTKYRKENKWIKSEIDRIKKLSKELKDHPNQKLFNWAKDYILLQPYGRDIIEKLNNSEILLLALSINGYSKSMISAILDMSLDRVEASRLNLVKILKKSNVSDSKINSILCF